MRIRAKLFEKEVSFPEALSFSLEKVERTILTFRVYAFLYSGEVLKGKVCHEKSRRFAQPAKN